MFKSNSDSYNDTNNVNNVLNDTHYNSTNNNNNANNLLFITIYIDDLLLFRSKGLVMDNLKDLLKSEFKVTDLGELH